MEVLRLRDEGLTFAQIGARLDPPVNMQRAHQLYGRALTEPARVPVTAEREASLRRLDQIAAEAWTVVRTEHFVVAGREGLVAIYNGEPVIDDPPTIRLWTRSCESSSAAPSPAAWTRRPGTR